MQSRIDDSVEPTTAPVTTTTIDDAPADTWGNRHGLKVTAAIMIGAFVLVILAQMAD